MQLRPEHCLAGLAFAVVCFCAGCAKDNPWTAFFDTSYSDDIHKTVQDKITEQTHRRTGAERGDRYKADEYQSPEDIKKDRARL